MVVMGLRVAAVQTEAIPGEVVANVDTAARLVGEAANEGARLVVFPEAIVTGYDESVFRGAVPSLDDSSWLVPLREAVDATGVVVVLNTALDHGDRLALSDVVLAPHEEPWVACDKQYLHPNEREIFTPGDHGASLTIDRVKLALSVCYDANFPEHAAAAAADGAILYVNSGAYFPGGAERRDLHNAARALDNSMYVLFSGLVGAPSDFIGGSAIFDPLGHCIAYVPAGEGIAVANIDPEVVVAVRTKQRMWADHRASLGPHTHRSFPSRPARECVSARQTIA